VHGHGLIDRGALVDQLLELAADVAEQQWPGDTEAHSLGGVAESDPEEDHLVTGERRSGRLVKDGAPAQRQDPNRPVTTVDPRDPNATPGQDQPAPPVPTPQ